MRIINKKYLLIILLVGVILTGVIILKPKEKVKLDNVVLKQEVNNRTFAMYKEEGNDYVPVNDNKFPDMYVLNLTKSKCIDNNGKELENVLSYENDKVIITSGNTTYCYLYFDKSLGLEIKEKEPNRLSTDKIRGAMYRFQGQANNDVQNYICFGTSDKEECVTDTDHHMYRIIGIESETGRVKVIKKEALEQTYQWHTDIDTDIDFPNSKIYEAIKSSSFLENPTYVPDGWEIKISNNTWMYGDMLGDDPLGANQTGEEVYKTETGQKATEWYNSVTKETPNAQSTIVKYQYSPHIDETIYYTNGYGNWTKSFEGKVSLMYLHDYNYSVSDEANCYHTTSKYEVCRTGWMHLSQNDPSAPILNEWTMSRTGYGIFNGYFDGHHVNSEGFYSEHPLANSLSVRPVFYLASVNELAGGSGKLDDPFIIK